AFFAPAAEFDTLRGQWKAGADIGKALSDKGITLEGFARLVRVGDLAGTGPLLAEEWDDVDHILVQVQKRRAFRSRPGGPEGWREAEARVGVYVGPDHFQTAPPPGPSEPPPPAWRADAPPGRGWQALVR